MVAPVNVYGWRDWAVLECPGIPGAAFILPRQVESASLLEGRPLRLPLLFCSSTGQVMDLPPLPVPFPWSDPTGFDPGATTGFLPRGTFNPMQCFF